MRHRSRLLTAAPACLLACLLLATGCDGQADVADDPPPATSSSADGAGDDASPPALTTIPDDFPLAAGMGDDVPAERSGAGLRDLELCGTSPLRGLSTRDRMVADDSGGEAADTRELVLLGSPDDARTVARMFTTLVEDCDRPVVREGTRTDTRVLSSAFGPESTTLVQSYRFGADPGTGATVVHVVPVGAALLVTSTYGPWTRGRDAAAVRRTIEPLRETVAALDRFAETDPEEGSS